MMRHLKDPVCLYVCLWCRWVLKVLLYSNNWIINIEWVQCLQKNKQSEIFCVEHTHTHTQLKRFSWSLQHICPHHPPKSTNQHQRSPDEFSFTFDLMAFPWRRQGHRGDDSDLLYSAFVSSHSLISGPCVTPTLHTTKPFNLPPLTFDPWFLQCPPHPIFHLTCSMSVS